MLVVLLLLLNIYFSNISRRGSLLQHLLLLLLLVSHHFWVKHLITSLSVQAIHSVLSSPCSPIPLVFYQLSLYLLLFLYHPLVLLRSFHFLLLQLLSIHKICVVISIDQLFQVLVFINVVLIESRLLLPPLLLPVLPQLFFIHLSCKQHLHHQFFVPV